MVIKQTTFIGSFPGVGSCPTDGKPEFAFIGRSNVGKSSLINMLCDRKNMAFVSKSPGKTQHLNYYLINDAWYLVDLPGYGYARISKRKRREWERMIHHYLETRPTLQCAFVLIDAKIPPQPIDIEFINWLGEARVPFVLVYTKTDKLSSGKIDANIERIREALYEHWNELPQEFETSSVTNKGREEILDFIERINAQTADL